MTGSQKVVKTIGWAALVAGIAVLVWGLVTMFTNPNPMVAGEGTVSNFGMGVLMVIGAVCLVLVGFEAIRAGKDAKKLGFLIGLLAIIALFQFCGLFLGITASLTNMEAINGAWNTLTWGPWNSLDWTETAGFVVSIICLIFALKAKKEQAAE